MKVKVIENFTLKNFSALKDLKRANKNNSQNGYLYTGDEFVCDEGMFKYLSGANDYGRCFVEKIKEVVEEPVEMVFSEEKKKDKKKESR